MSQDKPSILEKTEGPINKPYNPILVRALVSELKASDRWIPWLYELRPL
jgi:hypothetical protein